MQAGPSLTGSLLGGVYRVGRLLGEGAMGEVYEGTQEGLGRPVAIKVLKTRGELTSAQLERFGREARSAAALGHANIVQVTDFQASSEPPFLVMERLSGESLREAIAREKRLPTGRVALIGTQLLDALGAAHAAGIVHRDVKPDNVFLTKMAGVADVVKVLDFGIAKLESERALTAHGARMGSPAYMSPEQAAGRPADHRADLFCAGATLYHALAGRLPFDAQSLPELLEWIAERPPVPLAQVVPGIDPRMVAVLDRALQKDPANRFQSAQEMQRALEPLLPQSGGPRTVMAAPLAPPPQGDPTRDARPPLAARPGAYGTLPPRGEASGARTSSVPFFIVGGLGGLGVLALGLVALFVIGSRAAPPERPTGPHGPASSVGSAATASAPPPAAAVGKVTEEWSERVPSVVHCTAGRFVPFDGRNAVRAWRIVPPAAQLGLGSQLGSTLEGCSQRCPGIPDVASYIVRIYSDGEVTEAKVLPGTPTCPARDNCVDRAIRQAEIEAPLDDLELEVELACTFPRAPAAKPGGY